VLDISHMATMQHAADAYKNEHHRFVTEKLKNPWSFWMRSIAWNQIYARHMAQITPLGAGPWDRRKAAAGTSTETGSTVPMDLSPSLFDSWQYACPASSEPPPPPMRRSVASSSSSQGEGVSEYPTAHSNGRKWQYQGGKKRKWTDYDDECQEKLDYAAYAAKETADLMIDDWFYTVTFENMQQYSHEHGTIRYVRQVYVNMDEG
jgi:hypothetical protein